MGHSILNGHKQFRKRLELNVLEEIYIWKHIWNLMMHTWGMCESAVVFIKEQQVTVGSGKRGEFPSSPVYAKEGSWTTPSETKLHSPVGPNGA